MNIVVAGGGEIGCAIAQSLCGRHNVIIIDQSPALGDRVAQLDVQLLVGSATSAEVQARAGVDRADIFVASTGRDEVNIVACALARRRGALRTFCFVSSDEFFGAHDSAGLAAMGIDHVVWPEAQLAADIEQTVNAPGALDAEVFAGGAIRLFEYKLEAESSLAGQRIADLHFPPGALIVAVRRGDTLFIPRGDSSLAGGDRTVVMGTPEALNEVRRQLVPAANTARLRVTIIGGGDVGLQLAKRLEQRTSTSLTIVEREAVRGEVLASELSRALVLCGDGTDLELLEAADVGHSDVLVSVIDNDERNLFASLLGRQLGVGRTVTRVSRTANLRLFERVGIDVAISASGAAVASVLHHIDGGPSHLLAIIEQGAGRILEITVPSDYGPKLVRDLMTPRNCIVGAIVREKEAIVPTGATDIRAGDRLIVFTTQTEASSVKDFFLGAPF